MFCSHIGPAAVKTVEQWPSCCRTKGRQQRARPLNILSGFGAGWAPWFPESPPPPCPIGTSHTKIFKGHQHEIERTLSMRTPNMSSNMLAVSSIMLFAAWQGKVQACPVNSNATLPTENCRLARLTRKISKVSCKDLPFVRCRWTLETSLEVRSFCAKLLILLTLDGGAHRYPAVKPPVCQCAHFASPDL